MTPDTLARAGAVLRTAKTIAVVGLSPNPGRASHEVAAYLQQAGYRILPVRPGGGVILGEQVFPDLPTAARLAGPIDIVNVFRRSDAVAGLVDDVLAVHPKLVWMQVGVTDPASAARLEAEGIPVIMDRCLMVDHPWMASA